MISALIRCRISSLVLSSGRDWGGTLPWVLELGTWGQGDRDMRTENRSWHRSGAIPGWALPVQINPALHRCCFFVLFFSFCGPDEVSAPSLPICSAVENSWHRVGRGWHCPSGSSTSTLAPWGSFTELSLVLDTFNPHFLEAERLGRACCSSGAGEKPPGFFLRKEK